MLSLLVFRHSRFGARTHVSLQEDGPERVFSCQLSRGEICVANLKAPLPNGESVDRFLNGQFVKMGCCQTAQNGPILKIFGPELFKI